MDADTPLFRGLSPAALAFWAKSGDGANWLPLAQHMVDSACVAQFLWAEWASEQLRRSIAAECELTVNETGRLFAWLACIHDIGKATRQFTTQLDKRQKLEYEHFSRRVADAGLPVSIGANEAAGRLPHAAASRTILRKWLVDELGWSKRRNGYAMRNLSAIIDAHHGMSSTNSVRDHAAATFDLYEPEWQAAWKELLGYAADLIQVRPVLQRMDAGRLHVTGQMLLSGLIVMADWIASNELAFPMTVGPDSVAPRTWHEQVARVNNGVAGDFIDLTGPWHPEPTGRLDELMRGRFEWDAPATPRPVQTAIAEIIESLEGPALLVVEAPTGEGKTEAALLAAELSASKQGSGGLFFGAPTTATSDALFNRVVAWARHAVPKQTIASMYLGHSRRQLNETYQGLWSAQIDIDDTSHGWVAASQWLSGRKKGLLSNLVVGTVDQLLVMALQAKHSMLRHLSLADKVIIVDEVHAYDAYMGEYLQMALEWLSAYGATVVLLSATLPTEVKRELIDAYGRPHAITSPDTLSSGYPLITAVSRAGRVEEFSVTPRKADAVVDFQIIDDGVDHLVETLERETVNGGCVLVLCNSVIRAQAVMDALPPELHADAELLHARFVAADRLTREQRLVAEMGPDSHLGAGRPNRRIVVATQVAEQSLDIDVDLLITDIAPMDLLVQRVGRLHRHRRPASDRPEHLRVPRTLIRGIVQDSPVPEFDRHASGIYGDRLLLATLLHLQRETLQHGFTRPDDVPTLVQATYAGLDLDPEASAAQAPEPWREAWAAAHAEHLAKRELAQRRSHSFRFVSPTDAAEIQGVFSASSGDVAKDARSEERGYAQVRDSDPSLEAVVICDAPVGYLPLPWLNELVRDPFLDDAAPSRDEAAMFARSVVRLPRRCAGYNNSQFDDAITRLELQTPAGWRDSPTLDGLVALRLDANFEATLNGVRMRYSRDLGLQEVRE